MHPLNIDKTMENPIYTDTGSGEVLVFLHGFCESKEVWTEFLKPLQSQYRTITFDLPGFGNNTLGISDFSMDSMADEVKKQLDALEVKRCILIGHSMGGYVGMAVAEKYSRLLSGLCLFHSSALPDTEEKKQSRNKTIGFVEQHGVDKFMDSFIEPLFYEGNHARLKQEIELMKRIGRQAPQESVTGALAAMRDRPDRSAVLEQVKFPVLFIFGKEDGAVPLEKALEQCHLPDQSIVYFLGKTGHMGMFERITETQNAVERFAESVCG